MKKNLDNTISHPEDPFLHIVSLAEEYLHAPFISDTLLRVIQEQKANHKKTLIFYNRRGNSRAYICEDCGHYEKCPHCDIAFAYHNEKSPFLICHQCSAKSSVPLSCKKCSGNHFTGVGVGIQRVESDLIKNLGNNFTIQRIDSDTNEKVEDILQKINSVDIILASNRALSLTHPDI